MAVSGKGPRKARGSGKEVSIDAGRELALLVLCHLDACAPEQRAQEVRLLWAWAEGSDSERAGSSRPLAPGEPEPELSAGGQLARLYAQAEARAGAEQLVEAWIDQASEVDALIEEISQRWRLARMDVTDRNAIRLATLELKGDRSAKRPIVADAVRLASRYGGERSARFVNGLVESLAKHLRPDAST